MPSISIVIPVYNVRRYIDQCVLSVLEQTHSDFEALFIDDGATDGSMDPVRRFARNDSRIVIHTHECNSGLAAARNSGVTLAKSPYITFVDSDDFIAPNFLEVLMRSSDRGRFDMIETGVEAIDPQGELLWRYEPEAMVIENPASQPDCIFKIRELGVTQKLWRTSLFKGKIRFPVGAFWEDISVVLSLIAESRSMIRVPFVGYSYLQRPDSISNSKSVKHVLDIFRAFERYRKYLVAKGLFERYRATFAQFVDLGASYQIKQLGKGRPDAQTNLIQLCEVLMAEYLAGKADIDRLSEPQFEEIIRRPVRGGAVAIANFSDEFRATIRTRR